MSQVMRCSRCRRPMRDDTGWHVDIRSEHPHAVCPDCLTALERVETRAREVVSDLSMF